MVPLTDEFTYDNLTVAMTEECGVHRHHEWVPGASHHVWPVGDGGPNIPANRIWLCYNGHMSVHSYIDKLRVSKTSKAIPWVIRRRYGRRVRALAELGWDRIQRQAM